jgi:drug/metabolite transporter (DMT)-like permease
MRTGRAAAAALASVALWGAVFVAVHELLPVLNPLEMTTLRFGMVAATFAALMVARPAWRPRFTRREWGLCLAAGLLAVPATQLPNVDGQRFLSPALASLIVTTSPAVTAVLGASFLRERLGVRQAAGFAIALGGAALVIVAGAGTGADLSASDPLRAAVAALGPASWAAYTLVAKPLAARHHAVTAVGVAIIVGTVSLAPAVPAALASADDMSASSWAWLVFLAIGGTVVPYLLWSAALRGLEINKTAAFLYLTPVFAFAWSTLLLDTELSAAALAGGAIVLVGVILTQQRPASST